jgi:hypothetical protein
MKHVYSLAASLLALFFVSTRADGQFTAVRNGNWHVNSGPGVWQGAEPPASCNHCTITINSGVTVTLNTSITLSNSASLVIGTDPSLGSAVLLIPASGATGFAASNSVILANDGITPLNTIQLMNFNSTVDASGTSANPGYDGVLEVFVGSSPSVFSKLLGNGSSVFSGDLSINSNPVSGTDPFSGPGSINAGGAILPITLFNFQAVSSQASVNLGWTTSLELNFDYFAVERSTDGGSHWQTLGTVPAHGNSHITLNYSFTDPSPAPGVSEYRLRLVDQNGKNEYSPIKLSRHGLISGTSLFPNPARDFVNVSLGSLAPPTLSIRLISQSGQVVTERILTNAAGTTVSLPVSGLPQGHYMVLVEGADGSRQTSKVFIVHQ